MGAGFSCTNTTMTGLVEADTQTRSLSTVQCPSSVELANRGGRCRSDGRANKDGRAGDGRPWYNTPM